MSLVDPTRPLQRGIADARVQDADPGIRSQISADANNLRGSDDSFTDALLFSGSSSM